MADGAGNQRHKTRSAPPLRRAAEKGAARPEARATGQPIELRGTRATTSSKKAPALEMEEPIVTAGRAGELDITIEKFWVEVDGHLPAGFKVTTREGHGLDVRLEQLAYKRTYSGAGTLETGLTPIAPIGTTGRIVVTDTTTGEILEQPWTWHRRSWGSGLWQTIKRLIWKG